MANPDGVGTKFVSVNLNKSYGSVSNRNTPYKNISSYGLAAAGRTRGGSGRGGGGGGMVVLSRPKSGNSGTKLAVPPPLNLPSLRKEHERFDSSATGGGSVGLSGAKRPTSSGVGWTKPVHVALQDNSNGIRSVENSDKSVGIVDEITKGGNTYMPPSARLGGSGLPPSLSSQVMDKAAVLRGEDFPSLGAASLAQKQKESTHNQKQKQLSGDELATQIHATRHHTYENGSNGNGAESNGSGGLSMKGPTRKSDELFSGDLPLMRINPRSDWADDERDTGQGFVDRSRDYGYSNTEAYLDRGFDVSRNQVLSHQLGDNQFQKWGKREDGSVKTYTSEVRIMDSFVKTPSREGNSWRTSPLPRDGFDAVGGRTMDLNKYVPHRVGGFSRDSMTLNQELNSGRRDGFGQGHQRFHRVESSNTRVNDQQKRDLYGYNGSQNSSMPKSSFSPSGKGLHMNDSILNVGRDKHAFTNAERTNPVDAFLGAARFDEQDPFSNGPGVIKRKKDVKQADFHDPVRESFEAELERIQKMQEQERQRIIEEEERTLERARRAEEERERLIREEEEERRRVEEAAREAAWRAEQDRLEAIRRAEEQKIAREEEKRHMLMEEERRKQAAKQKLLDLEARMAKKKAVAVQDISSAPTSDEKGMEKDISKMADFESWEDSERMVDRIMTSGSSASSGPVRTQSTRDASSAFVKPANTWRRDVFESGNISSFSDQDNHSPRRDSSVCGRVFLKKDFHGGPGNMQTSYYYGSGDQENRTEYYPYRRNMERGPDFHDNLSKKYGDGEWGQGLSRGNAFSPYPERPTSEGDELYSYGRSRYSLRQPRVLPPPFILPVQKTSINRENEHPGPSSFTPCNISENEKQHTVSQEQMEKDFQSLLSVSSPPDSPTHLSRDDLEVSGDSHMPSATVSGNETVAAESGLISDADEDWSDENNKELQEQEEYDEDEDGYQEEDEFHEVDDENIDPKLEFDKLHIAEKGSLDMMENLVLAFNEGVEVGLPSDEFERSSPTEEGAFGEQEGLVVSSPKVPTDSSSRCILEADKEKNIDSRTVLSSGHLDIISRPTSSLVHGQHVSSSLANISSKFSAGQNIVSTIPVGASRTDLPIKLQFGLFSGPPFIPAPVPAIQIGSIQMPLHIHPSVNPSFTQLHQSQAPLFQFGKLRYVTPISQGMTTAPQMSFVQPNVQVHYNFNQSSGSQPPFQFKQAGLANSTIKEDVLSSSVSGGSNVVQEKVTGISNAIENKYTPEAAAKERFSGLGNYRQSNGTISKGMHQSEDSRGLNAPCQQSGFKSKRYAYVARNASVRSAFPAPETSRSYSGGFQRRPRRTVQRTEFRVRENVDNRPNFTGRNVGIFERSGSKQGSTANKSVEQMVELELSSSVQKTNTDFSVDREVEKDLSRDAESNSRFVEGNLKSNIVSEEDFDAPLHSGIVRVFKQPGIEALSDDDDFIQVRSKRQMLNDRREQREKEIKAKSQAPRRVGSIASSAVISRSSGTKFATLAGEAAKKTRSDIVPEGRGLINKESSNGFASAVSQPLAPIGTPDVATDVRADKRPQIIKPVQTDASSVIPDSKKNLGSGLTFEAKNKTMDEIQTSLGPWGDSHINQQVLALTQTQLDEAMRPGRFDLHVTSTSGHFSSVSPIMPSSSGLTASPVNSLLAGEKIQFGAVTSPTVLPPSSRAVSHVIKAPGSSRSDIQITNSLSTSESQCNMLFEKEKHRGEPCVHLEDSETEAEAAASAVAVAAITSDESVSVSDTKSFRGADVNGVARGNQQQSLSIALPADLSVETPPMSLWPPLPSPTNSSGQMVSHYPGGPSSTFPFYDMGPMLGGPIFAFGSHDESGGTQFQSPKSSVSCSGPLGAWQQFHSGPDSFYGPPARFTGRYSGPHGDIPGVQGAPRMVVYNHFPVGQYGQVGLSFMGTTYIPSGKQPDWKHNHASRDGDEDVNNMNLGSGQRNFSGMASPVQHLPPPSQLLPMPSPFALYDVSPFQPSPDISVQEQWPQVTSSPLHSVPLSMPLQQQETGEHLLTANRCPEPRTSTPSNSSHTFSFRTDSTIAVSAPSLDELRLVNSSVGGESNQSSTIAHAAKSDHAQSVGNNNNNNNNSNNNNNNTGHSMNTYRTRAPQPRNLPSQQQYSHHSTGYGYQRNRMGYNHGRANSMGTDKSFPSKMKQIYVAKQTTNGASTMG